MPPVSVTELKNRIESRIERKIEREAIAGLKQATWTRAAAMAAIGVWIAFQVPFPTASFYLFTLVLFVAIGLAHQLVVERDPARSWPGYLFITLDIVLLAAILIFPSPIYEGDWPQQMALRMGNFPYFYVFLAGTLLTYSPRQVIWAGVTISLLWSIAILAISMLPDTLTHSDYSEWNELSPHTQLQTFLYPTFVDVPAAFKDVFIVLVVTGVLASVVWRMRRLAFEQADVERQRANLARYFSPNLVEELTRDHDTLGNEFIQDAAVMFLDIRGFTSFAEQLSPRDTLELLRSFHSRMSQEVFAHGGTLDKFIGDGLMATFGVPKKGARDATNAIACAIAMRNAIVKWNQERDEFGYQRIDVGIGVHYGTVIMGDIGTAERLEFAVIGDTVNVASRIEHLTRDLGTDIALSDPVVAAAHAELAHDDSIFDGFREAPEQAIRGRLTGMIVWKYSDEAAEEDYERRLQSIDLAPTS